MVYQKKKKKRNRLRDAQKKEGIKEDTGWLKENTNGAFTIVKMGNHIDYYIMSSRKSSYFSIFYLFSAVFSFCRLSSFSYPSTL